MKKIIAMLVIVAMLAIPASAMTTGSWDTGAAQAAISGAVRQEVQRNPDWIQDILDNVRVMLAQWRK